MIRGGYIHHAFPEKHKNTRGAGRIVPQNRATALGSWGGGVVREMARLPRNNGPRVAQGVSPATSDALVTVESVETVTRPRQHCNRWWRLVAVIFTGPNNGRSMTPGTASSRF